MFQCEYQSSDTDIHVTMYDDEDSYYISQADQLLTSSNKSRCFIKFHGDDQNKFKIDYVNYVIYYMSQNYPENQYYIDKKPWSPYIETSFVNGYNVGVNPIIRFAEIFRSMYKEKTYLDDFDAQIGIFLDKHFGIIGDDETMIINEFIIY